MSVHLDMTFCPFWEDCKKASICHRPLTDEVFFAAAANDRPISRFADKPPCHEKTEVAPEKISENVHG
jgi:hypothetical protein